MKEKYGFEKLYSQGLSIRTPLNIDYQIQAIKSLRKGIEEYDRRHGWRGPIANKLKNKNWENILSQYKLDPTLNWKIAEIQSVNDTEVKFKTFKNKAYLSQDGVLTKKEINWTLRKKFLKSLEKDIIFVKKEN